MPSPSLVLVLGTGNNSRSQMLHGYLQHLLGPLAHVFSTGLDADGVHPLAVRVMAEDGVDIAAHTSDRVAHCLHLRFAHVVTVCDHAPWCGWPAAAPGARQHHCPVPDPAAGAAGPAPFRAVRDQLKAYAHAFVRAEFAALFPVAGPTRPPEDRMRGRAHTNRRTQGERGF